MNFFDRNTLITNKFIINKQLVFSLILVNETEQLLNEKVS